MEAGKRQAVLRGQLLYEIKVCIPQTRSQSCPISMEMGHNSSILMILRGSTRRGYVGCSLEPVTRRDGASP